MMPQSNISRVEAAGTLAAGEERVINVNGDYWYIDELTAPIELSMNGNQFALVRVGATFQGTPGAGEVYALRLKNTTASPCTFRVVFGLGRFANPANVVIQNPNFTLSPADIAALQIVDAASITSIRGATETHTPGFDLLTGSQTYVACRGLTVYNSGAVNITVLGKALPPGMSLSWSCNGRFDRLSNIAIDATGGAAIVTYVS